MSTFHHYLGVLGTFAFGRALAGLRDLGSHRSAFAGLGAMPTNAQERVLERALIKLSDEDAGIRHTVDSYGAEGEDILQNAKLKILMRFREWVDKAGDAGRSDEAIEAWIKQVVTPRFLMRSIQNAWVSYMRSGHYQTMRASAELETTNKEGESRRREPAASPEQAFINFIEHQQNIRRELPTRLLPAFEVRTRGMTTRHKAELRDLLTLGARYEAEARKGIETGSYSPAEARRMAYEVAAQVWSKRHPTTKPYADAADFQSAYYEEKRKLVRISRKLSTTASSSEPGVFLSDRRTREELVNSDEVELDLPEGKRPYIRPHSAFVDELFTRGKSKSAKEIDRIQRREAQAAAKAQKAAAKDAAKAAKKAAKEAARANKVEKKKNELAKKRAEKASLSLKQRKDKIDEAAQLLLKKRRELAEKAEKLKPEDLERRRAVLDKMAADLAKKRAEIAEQAMRQHSGSAAVRESQAIPSAPSLADGIMATRAVDVADAKAEAYNAQKDKLEEAKAKAGVNGISAFAGLFGKGKKRKARKSRRSRR